MNRVTFLGNELFGRQRHATVPWDTTNCNSESIQIYRCPLPSKGFYFPINSIERLKKRRPVNIATGTLCYVLLIVSENSTRTRVLGVTF